MDVAQFRILLEHLNLSWRGYRKVRRGVQRRLRRHMQHLRCNDIRGYLERLDENDLWKVECDRLLTVPISRFFRDRPLWRALEDTVLPALLDPGCAPLSVWSAGCARGEEVYSFKMLWHAFLSNGKKLPPLTVLATDIHPDYLASAQRGVYGPSSLKEVSEGLRSRWFRRVSGSGGDQFAIDSTLGRDITWQVQDLRGEPPAAKFHLIFLRNNVLTYCREEVQRQVLSKVKRALASPGFLSIGSHERLPDGACGLVPLPECRYIFKNAAT